MMRIILAILASISLLSSKAQTHLPVSSMPVSSWNYAPFQSFTGYNQLVDPGHPDHKWHISQYAGLSAGSVFFAGSMNFVSAPIGLQLSRPLNKNLYAFAGASAAPVYFSFNRLITEPVLHSSYPGNLSNAYGFGLSSRIEAGLMYINDAKTFSISGSIGIERTSYPVYPANRTITKKQ